MDEHRAFPRAPAVTWRVLLVTTLAVLFAGCSEGDRAEPRTVVVEIEHSRFRPASFTFARGATIRFLVRNNDPIDHEFLIGDRESQALHEKGTEAHHGARPGEISIPAGEERTTTYTFAERGTLIVGCHLPRHYDYGMRGGIEIV